MKSSPLVIGVDGFALPIQAVTESIGVLAKRRAGKSTTARRLTEQLYAAKQQIAIVDPKGDWHGLLYARDGTGPGLPFIVLGGEHGHVPLELNAGEVVARLVVEERVNVIVDLSRFRKNDIPTFMTPFLETLYRLKAQEQYRTAMMLILDEADAIAPQKPERKGESLMASAVEDIVRRGGQRGMGCMVITQRAAVLSKNVLTQIGILIILRTIAPQDLRAMDAWVSAHGTDEQRAAVRASLPTMRPGEAFVWAPGWPDGDGIFARVQMALPDTYDSSSTPQARGRRARAPKHPAQVDLGALQLRMAATIAAQKENDPKELRAALAAERLALLALKREHVAVVAERDRLAHAGAGKAATAERHALERLRVQAAAAHDKITGQLGKLRAIGVAESAAWSAVIGTVEHYMALKKSVEQIALAKTPLPPPRTEPVAATPTRGESDADIGKGELATLRAIVSAGKTSREYLTLLTGYKKTTRNAYVQRLAARGLVSVNGDAIEATDAGAHAAGPVDEAPTGPALVDWWLARLPVGEAAMLRLVLEGVSDRDALSDRSGFKKTTRNAYLQRLATRRLVWVDGTGAIRPHRTLT